MSKKIKNENYRRFLDEGIIETIGEEEFKKAISNVKGKYFKQGRALLAVLYYTGCRPVEALELRPKDFERKGQYLTVKVPGKKGGLPRTIYIKRSRYYVQQLEEYALSLFDTMLLFYKYRNNYKRTVVNKKGEVKVRIETTDKLRYYFKIWFKGVIDISPYYLRHNRFSKLAEAGVDMQDIRMLKGSRTIESITPYIHLSTKSAKTIAKKLD